MTAHPRFLLGTLTALGGLLISTSLVSRVQAADAPKVAGSWTWSWKDPAGETHQHLLEVEGIGAKLAARERFDDLAPVKATDLKLDGKKFSFKVVRDKRTAEYSGVVADDAKTINGTVTVTVDDQSTEYPWKAELETKKTEAAKP